MKFLSKKSTAIILAALMALPLAACGNQKSSTEATVATIDEAVHSTAASTADQSGTSAKNSPSFVCEYSYSENSRQAFGVLAGSITMCRDCNQRMP